MKSTASDLFEKGVKAMAESKWEECRANFLAAWNIHPAYQIAGNLAECEIKLARYAEAAEHLTFFLREMPATAPAERKARGEGLLREVRPRVAEVTIRTSKSDAEVLVDGRSVGRSPLAAPVFVEPGDRKLEAKLGGSVARAAVSAKGGGTQEVTLRFEEAVTPRPARSVVPAIVLGGAAVIVAGVGVGLSVAAHDGDRVTKGIADDIGKKGGTCVAGASNFDARCDDLISRARANDTMSRASVGLFVGAAALAAGTALYVLWPGAAPVRLGATVVPDGARSTASLQLSGTF